MVKDEISHGIHGPQRRLDNDWKDIQLIRIHLYFLFDGYLNICIAEKIKTIVFAQILR